MSETSPWLARILQKPSCLDPYQEEDISAVKAQLTEKKLGISGQSPVEQWMNLKYGQLH